MLLACFLGMSVGLLAARRPQDLVQTALPVAMLSFAAAIAVHLLYWQWADDVTIGLDNQQTSPQIIYFGTGAFFALIALAFVGLGQVMGRAFDALPDRVMAYTVDVCSSLTGIAAFAAMSYFQLAPTTWFVPIALLMLRFAGWRRPVQAAAAAAMLVLVGIGAHGLTIQGEVS